MTLGGFDYYLIIINIVGFIFYGINILLYKYTAHKQIDFLLTLTSLAGGSLGILLFIILFDRKSVKENMMSRVFVACVFVIQTIILLMVKGHISDKISFDFIGFFAEHKILLYYICAVNILTFISYAADKYAAVKNKRRIRIVTLLGLAFIGGSIGAISAMYIFRHKTKKDYFSVGVPLIILMQICIIFFVMNFSW